MHQHQKSVLKGIAAGCAGGLLASWVMNEYQTLWQRASSANGGSSSEDGDQSSNPTVKAAAAVSEGVFGHGLERDEQWTGSAVHYSFGTAVGAVYGAIAEKFPKASSGAGLPFGAAVWLGADEIAVPALSLSKSPAESPASNHAYALTSHLVYGVVADSVRRLIRRFW